MAATSGGVLADELIPDGERAKLWEILTPEGREAVLLKIGRRFSEEGQAITGAIAESLIVTRCQAELLRAGASDLADSVCRVSEVSDQLGYDITAPRLDRTTRRIETKGTRASGTSVVFYLSRNEAERGLIDADWSLVVCRVLYDDTAEIIGHLKGVELRSYLPEDPGTETRWQSIRLELPETVFTSGLPPI
jgi:hypothetical protein